MAAKAATVLGTACESLVRARLETASCPARTVLGDLKQHYAYDEAHQLIGERLHEQPWRSYDRNVYGEIEAITSPKFPASPGTRGNKFRHFGYDELGRLELVTDEEGNETHYDWEDVRDNLEAVRAPAHTVSFTYDDEDRVLTRTESPGGTTHFEEYTPEGDPVRVLDANGAVIVYGYDELRRRTSASYQGTASTATGYTASAPLVSQIEWDYEDGLLLEDVTVRHSNGLQEVTDYQDFNVFGQPQVVVDRGRIINYAYDRAGNVASVRIGGEATSYGYDDRGRMDRVTVIQAADTMDPEERVSQYRYTQDGRLATVSHPNGTSTAYAFHPETLRVSSVTHAGPGSATIARVEYDYDVNGNVTRRALTSGGTSEVFTTIGEGYDAIDRLREFQVETTTGGQTETVATLYNMVGYHRDRETTTRSNGPTKIVDYTYTGDRLTGLSADGQSWTYAYDNNGNRISKSGPDGTVAYVWDVRDQLAQVLRGSPTSPEVVGQYRYDAEGQRIFRQDATGSVRGHWALGNLIQERNVVGDALVAHHHHAQHPVAVTGAEDEVDYYHQDLLGTTLAMSKDGGSTAARFLVHPFGRVTASSGEDQELARFVYTGHENDTATGLVYMKARYYDADTGGFLSRDPLVGADMGNPYTWQAYRYAFGNPLRYTDPTGQFEAYDRARAWLRGARQKVSEAGVAAQEKGQNCQSEDGTCSNLGIDLLRGFFDIELGAAQLALGAADFALSALNGLTDASILAAHDLGIYDALPEDMRSAEHNQQAFRGEVQTYGANASELGSSLSSDFTGTVEAMGQGAASDASSFANSAFVEGDSRARATVGEVALGTLIGGPKPSAAFASVGSSVRAGAQVARAAVRTAIKQAPVIAAEARNGAVALAKALGEGRIVVNGLGMAGAGEISVLPSRFSQLRRQVGNLKELGFSRLERRRAFELAVEPGQNKFQLSEGVAAVRFERSTGRSLTRSLDPAVDFIDEVLGPIDVKGPLLNRVTGGAIPPGVRQGSLQGLAKSVIKEVNQSSASRAVVVDTLGLTAQEAAALQSTVTSGVTNGKAVIYLK